MGDVARILDLLREGIPLSLLLDLADPELSSELILVEERAASAAA